MITLEMLENLAKEKNDIIALRAFEKMNKQIFDISKIAGKTIQRIEHEYLEEGSIIALIFTDGTFFMAPFEIPSLQIDPYDAYHHFGIIWKEEIVAIQFLQAELIEQEQKERYEELKKKYG